MIIDINKIKENPDNPRTITEDKFKKLVKSLKELPDMINVRPIVIDENMIVLGGNMRLRAMKQAGIKKVPVHQVKNWSDEQKKQFVIKDNIGYGTWDWDLLANEWDTEKLNDWGLDFDFKIEPEAEEDNYIEPNDLKVDVVLGDLIEIGEHRLLCGDSTDADQLAKLMNGEKADMVFTDPPYGISHSGKGITAKGKGNNFGEILGDNDISVANNSFNLIYNLYPNAIHIWWGANYYCQTLLNGFGWLVWDKQKEGNTFSGAELAFVNKGVRLDVFRHLWHGMIKGSEMGQKRLHPTQKPVALVEWCFNNYKAKNLIADFFLGSGSTMVAAHQLKRKCYGMELDPKYCQVIIDRMQKLDSNLQIKINGKLYKKTEGFEIN